MITGMSDKNILPFYPDNEIKEFGEKLNLAMFDAAIEFELGDYKDCHNFNLNTYPTEFHPYILEYLKGNCNSLAITYAAMRDKEQEQIRERDAEIERLRAAMQWRPIETAPRDGTEVLLYTAQGMIQGCFAYGDWEQSVCAASYDAATAYIECVPTHWQPLPEPPKEAT
jgi:hypothetical protein